MSNGRKWKNREELVRGSLINCTSCNAWKDNSLFYRGRYKCKSCITRDTVIRNRKYPRDCYKSKQYHLKTRFNLTVEEFDKMVLDRNSTCPICNKICKLVVDHCHETNRVRGLLCSVCNSGLGKLGDNKEGLLSAIKYLDGT